MSENLTETEPSDVQKAAGGAILILSVQKLIKKEYEDADEQTGDDG